MIDMPAKVTEFRLRPDVPKLPWKQCDEPYDDSQDGDHYKVSRRASLIRHGKDPDKCRNPAVYKIGARCFWSPHAGRRLIALVCEGKITLPEDLP